MDRVLILGIVGIEQLIDLVVVVNMVALSDLMCMALWVTIMVAIRDLGITLSHYLSSATPCLNPEVCNTIVVLDSLMFIAVHQLMLDSVLLFLAVHLLISHILLSERLLEEHRFIVAEFQTNSLFLGPVTVPPELAAFSVKC